MSDAQPNSRTCRKWAVYEEDNGVHVVPLYGRMHELIARCWCEPKRQITTGEDLWIHKLEQ